MPVWVRRHPIVDFAPRISAVGFCLEDVFRTIDVEAPFEFPKLFWAGRKSSHLLYLLKRQLRLAQQLDSASLLFDQREKLCVSVLPHGLGVRKDLSGVT